MINHARNLLLNINGGISGFSGYPGDEFVPPDYRQLALPSQLVAVRRHLFGTEPDRHILNYRARQYMALLHDSELQQFILGLDKRFTYSLLPNDELFSDLYDPVVTPLGDSVLSDFYLFGTPDAPDDSGRSTNIWTVTDNGGGAATVTRTTPPASTVVQNYTVASGLSSEMSLQGSGMSFRIRPATGASWGISAYARPVRGMGEIAANIRSLPSELQAFIFNRGNTNSLPEPMATFRNLWHDHPEFPYQFGGLLLGLIYHTDAVRKESV